MMKNLPTGHKPADESTRDVPEGAGACDPHLLPGAACVLKSIAERFLDDAVERDFHGQGRLLGEVLN